MFLPSIFGSRSMFALVFDGLIQLQQERSAKVGMDNLPGPGTVH